MAFAAAATEAVTTKTRQWLNLLRYQRRRLRGGYNGNSVSFVGK